MKKTGLGNLTNEEINGVFGIAFRYLFLIRSDLFLKVNSAMHLLGLDMHKYIGVHIRTGFVEAATPEEPHTKLVREVNQWKLILTCAVSVSNNSPIFLATDSTSVKHLAVEMYGSQYKTLHIQLTHIDGIDIIGPDAAESEGLLSTWVDFFLLAQSYVQVRTGSDWVHGSGFALGASHLCGLPRSQRIDGLEIVPPKTNFHIHEFISNLNTL